MAEAVVVKLVRLLARMFYEPAYFILLDMVLHDRIVAEDVLAERLQMQLKQVNRITVKLRDDRFLQSEARVEIRELDGKSLTRTYWYLDFKGFVEATRWRLKKMSRTVEEMIQRGAQGGQHGYKCTKCSKTYGLLDVDRLVTDFRKGTLQCEVCKGEVEDEDTMSSAEAADLYSRMNQALKPAVALLKEIELAQTPLGTSKSSPPMGNASLSDSNADAAYKNDIESNSVPNIEPQATSVFGSGPSIGGDQSKSSAHNAVTNVMPEWHSHSTVSGQAVKFQHAAASTTPTLSTDDGTPKVITTSSTPLKKRHFEDVAVEEENADKISRGDDLGDDSVMVMVQGKSVPLMQVTEADKLAMSKEESEAYYEAFMNVFGESSFI